MNEKIRFISRFVYHSLKARSKFDLHSPFVYHVYSKILKDKSDYPEYRIMNAHWEKLLHDQRYISRIDLGARGSDVPWQKKILSIRKLSHDCSVGPHFGRLLFRIVRYFKPGLTLELGTSLGLSTAYMAFGNPEGKIITLEGSAPIAAEAERNFEHLGLVNIDQRIGRFDDELPGILKEVDHFDLVFIDGNHKKEATMKYFQLLLEHLMAGSILIIDDIHWSKGMEEAWKEISAHPKVKVTMDLFRMGLVFFRDELSKEDFTIHY